MERGLFVTELPGTIDEEVFFALQIYEVTWPRPIKVAIGLENTLTRRTMTSAKYEKLLLWARSNGAIIPETLIFPPEPYGHCRTTVTVPQGTQLFKLPHNIIITPEVARREFPRLKFENVHLQMCTFIASQRGKEGFWKDYLDSLPETFTTPPYFTPEELKVLEGTNLAYAWKDVENIWKKEWERASIIVDNLPW